MTKQDISVLGKEDAFKLIGKEWMLVTAGTEAPSTGSGQVKFNTMTASWGGIGWLWNKPVSFLFVRPERYTHDFIDRELLDKWYGAHGGLHTVYVVEIESVYTK